MHTILWLETLRSRFHLEDLGVDGKIIRVLKLTLGNRVGGCGLDASGSGQGLVAGPWEHDNEHSGSIQGGEFD